MKKVHPIDIPHYEDNLDGLVDFIVGTLRYDQVEKFHRLLSERYWGEAVREVARKHPKLSLVMEDAAKAELKVAEHLRAAWEICKPFTAHDGDEYSSRGE